jgi:nucleoside-diphosphate-sugar epimerase
VESTGITVVTGASGFLGRHLVAALVQNGVSVRAAVPPWEDRSVLAHRNVEVVCADLAVPETLPPLFAGAIDRVFHLAAICNFSTPYSVLRRVNVAGVERITALALAAGVRVFVHVSSTSVYGPFRGIAFGEDAPREPQDDYGRSKRDGEDVVWRCLAEGLPAIVLRPCTVYGPGCTDGAGKVFSRPTSLRAIPGDGRQRLSNVRVEDVVAAAQYLSRRADAVGQAFNVADDSHPSIAEALALAAAAFGVSAPRRHLPLGVVAALARVQGVAARLARRVPDLETDAVRYLGTDYLVDNTKLKAAGYQLRYPDFAASMRELGRCHRDGRAA